MTMELAPRSNRSAALHRLSALSPLTQEDRRRLHQAEGDLTFVQPHRDLIREGEPISGPRVIVDGWAYRALLVPDGRRQIIDIVVPGELIGMCTRRNPVAVATTTALTRVTTCPAPIAESDDISSGLKQAYAIGAALEEAYFCRHIRRLGRMNAYERVSDWLLELYDRLAMSGLAHGDDFTMPLTQELMGDLLGLTSVHVNRTIKALREDGLVTIGTKRVRIHNREKMRRLVCYEPVKPVF